MYLVLIISMLNFLLNKRKIFNLSLFILNNYLIAKKFNLMPSYDNDTYVTDY